MNAAKTYSVLLSLSWGLCSVPGQQAPAATNTSPTILLSAPVTVRTTTNSPALPALAALAALPYEQVEQLYLEGKLSARQLQKLIEMIEDREATRGPNAINAMHSKAIEVLRHTQPDLSKNPAAGPAIASDQVPLLVGPTLAGEDPVEKGFSEIEAKMDELLSFKLQREQEIGPTNAAPASGGSTAGALTKRQRLNDLLRLYIRGKLSEEDYNRQRAAIIAEKESPKL